MSSQPVCMVCESECNRNFKDLCPSCSFYTAPCGHIFHAKCLKAERVDEILKEMKGKGCKGHAATVVLSKTINLPGFVNNYIESLISSKSCLANELEKCSRRIRDLVRENSSLNDEIERRMKSGNYAEKSQADGTMWTTDKKIGEPKQGRKETVTGQQEVKAQAMFKNQGLLHPLTSDCLDPIHSYRQSTIRLNNYSKQDLNRPKVIEDEFLKNVKQNPYLRPQQKRLWSFKKSKSQNNLPKRAKVIQED